MPAAHVVASRRGTVASGGAVAGWRVDIPTRVASGRVLAVHADIADWRPWLEAAQALLDDAERARVSRLQRAGDRDDRAIAYALHRIVAAQVTGFPARALRLTRDVRGCPRLDASTTTPGDVTIAAAGDAPTPLRLYTSLSHGDGVVAIAFATGRVGIDIEASARAAGMAGIAGMLCHDDELALAADDDDALLALWVRKEALLKATGRGLAIAMTTFHAPPAQPFAWPDGAPGRAVVRMLDAGGGLRLAVATAHGVVVDHRQLRPVAGAALPPCPAAGCSRVR